MPNVPWKFSEYGLGGGANVGSCSLTQESPNRCPWEGPLQLKEKACPTLWAGENKELRYSYYKALVDFMGYSDHRIDSAYLWNLDTWDVQGIYKGLLESSEPCRDEQIEAMLKNYNSKFTKLYGPQGSSGGGDSAEVCHIKDVAVQGQNVVVDGADSGLKVSGDQIVSTEAGAERPIIAITGGIYGWIPGIDHSRLDASKRKVAEAIVGSTPQKLENGEVVVEDCGTRRQDVPYELGDKVSFSNMIVEFVYVNGEKSQVYLSGGYVYVYSDSGEQKIGTYLPDDSTIQIDSLDNVKTDPGYFSIFDFRNFFVFERDYNILTTLKNGEYSYCDLGGEDCGSSEAKEGVLSNICEDVCAGFFGCNRNECDVAGDCYFVGRALAKNECHSCEGMSCIAYPNEETCTDDMCGISCEWDDTDDLCFGLGSNIIERSGKTPCFDLEGRLKVDFGESIRSYGLSSGNRLEWYLDGVGWIDVKSDSRANWNSKTPQLKEWAIQLERELVNLKNSGSELMTCRDSELSLDNVVLVFNEASAELTFYYRQPSGALEDFNLRIKPDNEFIENRQGVGLASLNKKVGGIVAGSPIPLIGVGNFACIHVSSEKFENVFYGKFKVGDLDKSKIVRVKQTGNDQFDLMPDDGSCEIVEEPFSLEDMFELVEASDVVRFYFHPNRESSLKDTGLYINLNEGGGVVIKNQAGPAVGSLSDSISAMRHAGKTPVIGITNHVDVLIDGSPAFKTSCLDQQQIVEQDGKLKIDFVNGAATGCPEL
jgi:hypothetical protein